MVTTATFIGIDLAWSDRNPTGLAHLVFDGKAAELLATAHLVSDQEIIDWISMRAQKTTWLGIDGPIIAPNPAKTSRPADKLVSSLFGRFHAGVYPGNQEKCVRPIRLCNKLMTHGFSPDPFLPLRGGKRQLEIFPHLAQIALFGTKRIIKYKKGGVDYKRHGLKLFQCAIATLTNKNPPLCSSRLLRELLTQDPDRLSGRELKGLEDRLDALLCAYMTLYFWQRGEEQCAVYGDLKTGYIIGPKQIEKKSRIEDRE
ncbi:MAG TPA: DUF429 domain-containing protein [Candidatus Binatia bacterium]|nr:DUF429 domain-containing protein [Candidatus Binatia bacterium]